MLPHEREMVARLKDKPFTLLGINSDKSRSALKKTLKDENITWPNIFDGPGTQGKIATEWNVRGWPTIYLLDHEGRIVSEGLRDQGLEREVNRLLAKIKN